MRSLGTEEKLQEALGTIWSPGGSLCPPENFWAGWVLEPWHRYPEVVVSPPWRASNPPGHQLRVAPKLPPPSALLPFCENSETKNEAHEAGKKKNKHLKPKGSFGATLLKLKIRRSVGFKRN